jgi:hypothetical protein
MKIATPNPTHREWVVEDEKEFVRWAFEFLKHKQTPTRTISVGSLSPNEYPVARFISVQAVIKWLYKLGQDLQRVRMSFDEFDYILGEKSIPYEYDARWRYRHSGWGRWGGYRNWVAQGYFRGPRSYVKATHHEPKVFSGTEQADRDWRDRKQFKRDKARHGWHYRGGSKRWVKQICNRSYRRYEKLRIKNEDYDALETVTPKDWFDPWMWD